MDYLDSDAPILVVIGPSGSGKSSVVQELVKRGVVDVSPTWTTRPARAGELNAGVEHKFVSEQEFTEVAEAGAFLETVQMFGLPYWYGLPRVVQPGDQRLPLIMLRASLLPMLPRYYTVAKVYQIEDELSNVKQRLQERTAAGEEQGSRLEDYQKEMKAGRQAAHRIFTNSSDIKTLADDIEQAIRTDFAS